MPALGPIDLTPLNTLRLPATARAAWQLENVDELEPLGRFLDDRAAAAGTAAPAPIVIGGGSNLLIARDLAEPVIIVRTRGRRIVHDDGERVVVELAAGEPWDDVVRWTLERGLSGLENLALIPGTAGAAPWQNIGAYGVELSESVVAVDAWHLRQHRLRSFDNDDCAFGYRDSIFKRVAVDTWLIVAVRLALSRRHVPRIEYGEIRAELGIGGQKTSDPARPPSARAIADAVTRIRRRKLPDPAVIGNVGSFFKNPLIDAENAARLRATIAARCPASTPPPVHAAGDRFKVSAAWLIEACGWKGHRDGDAGVSPGHALVLVNHGRARADQVLGLARRIQASVFERFGIALEPEPRIIA
jgi:UDP-N-acetylmuramate dehydrogenase